MHNLVPRDEDGKTIYWGEIDPQPTLARIAEHRKLRFLHDVIVHSALPLLPRGDQLPAYLAVLAGSLQFREEKSPQLQVVFPTTWRDEVEAALSNDR